MVNESFTPFGARRYPSSWSGSASTSDLATAAGISRQGYTSQTQLGLWTGLNHVNGRVQDAVTGRFLSPDPVIQDPTFTQGYNRYSYVNNNPLTYTDPSGFDCFTPSDGSDGVTGTWSPDCEPDPDPNPDPGYQFSQSPAMGGGGASASGIARERAATRGAASGPRDGYRNRA